MGGTGQGGAEWDRVEAGRKQGGEERGRVPRRVATTGKENCTCSPLKGATQQIASLTQTSDATSD
ncbi:hypothetical protein E2C01_098591 [Portunus trituberculatus]|uniref:Uncharacterized protein n=1 Tax=Portunus trituberculatus TaxID=210409 RepID=A0A5B7KDA9_PORTR|nr:hypothetical protein [Portunus trituberculatus]